MHSDTTWFQVIPTDSRRPLGNVKDDLPKYQQNLKQDHAYDGDIRNYRAALKDMKDTCVDELEWESRRAELDGERAVSNEARRQVSCREASSSLLRLTCTISMRRHAILVNLNVQPSAPLGWKNYGKHVGMSKCAQS